MTARILLAAASVAAMLTACAGAPVDRSSTVAAAVAAAAAEAHADAQRMAAVHDPARPEEDTSRDALRKPFEMLQFMDLKPGDVIADIRPEEGYFTRLFAPVVGEAGHVYAFVPTRTAAREDAYADALAAAYPNVSRVTGRLEDLTLDRPLDVIFTAQEYHDFTMPRFEVDVAAMNRAAFRALKPGGLYVVIDHSGRPGTGATEASTLHRIEGAEVRRQVEAAGFIFDGESTVLANPADDRTVNVFDEAIRGRTDQFVYRFRKPG